MTRLGPLRLVTFAGGRGFITYQDLGGADADSIVRMVGEALAHFQADPQISKVEWKTRGHDHAPGLHEALLSHGFTPDESESIMVGDARALAVDVPLPGGVTLRQITDEADIRAMVAMQDEVSAMTTAATRCCRARCSGWPAVTSSSCGWPRRTGW